VAKTSGLFNATDLFFGHSPKILINDIPIDIDTDEDLEVARRIQVESYY
jgi:hypothetical protein